MFILSFGVFGWGLAAVIARRSFHTVERFFLPGSGSSPVYAGIHRGRDNAVWRLPVMLLQQRSVRRDAGWERWGWGHPRAHDQTLSSSSRNELIGPEITVSWANGGWWIILRTERRHACAWVSFFGVMLCDDSRREERDFKGSYHSKIDVEVQLLF